MNELAGRVALITGAAGGVGAGIAHALGAAGMRLALADIEKSALERTALELSATGAPVLAVVLDVTSPSAWQSAVDETVRELGPIDVLCNNAGVACNPSTIESIPLADLLWLLDINLHGVLHGVRAVVPQLKARGCGGHIVNTASMAGLYGNPLIAPYTASKFAVVGLSEALRLELEPFGIGVSVLCPGQVRTRIAANTARRLPSRAADGVPAPKPGSLQNLLSGGMDPRALGERVLAGIRHNEPYILTHAEYRSYVQARLEAILGAFGPSAQSGYQDDLSFHDALKAMLGAPRGGD